MTPLALVDWTSYKSSVQICDPPWFVFITEGKEFRTSVHSAMAPAFRNPYVFIDVEGPQAQFFAFLFLGV